MNTPLVQLHSTRGPRDPAPDPPDHPAVGTPGFAATRAWAAAVHDAYRLPTLVAHIRHGATRGAVRWHLLRPPTPGGRYLCAGPFASWSGPWATDPDTWAHLVEASRTLATGHGAAALILRTCGEMPVPVGPRDRVERDRFVTALLALEPDPERVFARLQGRARQFVRKARRLGVHVAFDPPWDTFLHVMTTGARALGSPFHGRSFLAALQHRFGPRCIRALASVDGRPAAAVLAIVHGDTMHYVYGQNIRELRASCANTAVLWALMERACLDGLARFDLGRSEVESSQLRFKMQWNPRIEPVVRYTLHAAGPLPADLSPTNPRFALAQRAWRRLPLPLARALGPPLIRGIG